MTKCTNKIDCQLNCKATAELNDSVLEDLKKEDKCLSGILGEEDGPDDKIKEQADP